MKNVYYKYQKSRRLRHLSKKVYKRKSRKLVESFSQCSALVLGFNIISYFATHFY